MTHTFFCSTPTWQDLEVFHWIVIYSNNSLWTCNLFIPNVDIWCFLASLQEAPMTVLHLVHAAYYIIGDEGFANTFIGKCRYNPLCNCYQLTHIYFLIILIILMIDYMKWQNCITIGDLNQCNSSQENIYFMQRTTTNSFSNFYQCNI